MRKLLILTITSMFILGICLSVAGAFTMSEKVVVANELVAIVRVPAGGLTADERIDRVNERLAYILGFEPINPSSIRAVPLGNSRMIMIGDSLLMTVTPRDAEANNTTVAGLTRVWVQQAREAIPFARPTPSVPG